MSTGPTIGVGGGAANGLGVLVPREPNLPALVVELETTRAPASIEIGISQGLRGPRGTWGVDRALLLRQLTIPIVDGRIVVNFREANTYYLLLTEDVVAVEYTEVPAPGTSSRVQVYVQQDEIGGREISGWPAGTRTPSGLPPDLTPGAGAMDSVVLDTFDGGATTQLNLVGQDYADLAP